jgi:hypothetical protein
MDDIKGKLYQGVSQYPASMVSCFQTGWSTFRKAKGTVLMIMLSTLRAKEIELDFALLIFQLLVSFDTIKTLWRPLI